MKLWELESVLQTLDLFESPKVILEQYPTPPEVASRILHILSEAIAEKTVVDLGCGTGMLSIGASLVGADRVIGFDIDSEALSIANENLRKLDLEDDNISFIHGDVSDIDFIRSTLSEVEGDIVVISNPPFGTRSKGADITFLETASKISSVAFTMHKSSTREHILKSAKALGGSATAVYGIDFPIPAMYNFHKEKTKSIKVDLIKFIRL